MAAVEELKKELEAKVDIDSIAKDITITLDRDMRSMCRGGWSEEMNFREDLIFNGGFDITGQLMVKLGLIRAQQSPFNPGSYSYTLKARDLYAKLQEEKYYEPKTK